MSARRVVVIKEKDRERRTSPLSRAKTSLTLSPSMVFWLTSEATQPSVWSGCQALVPTSYVCDMALRRPAPDLAEPAGVVQQAVVVQPLVAWCCSSDPRERWATVGQWSSGSGGRRWRRRRRRRRGGDSATVVASSSVVLLEAEWLSLAPTPGCSAVRRAVGPPTPAGVVRQPNLGEVRRCTVLCCGATDDCEATGYYNGR